MRRVLHVGKFFPPYHGGMEVFLADLVAAQQAQGMDVSVLVHGVALAEDPPWLERVPVQAQLIYAPVALGFRAALGRAIARTRPDVIHLHMPNTSVFWALTLEAAREIPWVVHWHSDVVVSRISKSLALAYNVYRPFEQAVLDRAERIIVTSPPYLAASQPLAPWRDKCSVVPLGLSTGTLTPPASGDALESLPWTKGRFRLLSIGRLTYYKGFETLVRVMAEMPGAELLVVGGGELQPQLEAMIRTLTPAEREPAVKLLGPVSEASKHALLQSCDAFCLASCERTEAFGMVLLEAMAHRKPCIVSDLPGSGMPWLIAQAGAGVMVPLDNTNAWRQAISDLQRSDSVRSQLGESGYRALRTRFSIEACAQALALDYAKVWRPREAEHAGNGILIVIPAKDEAATIGTLIQSLVAAGWTDIFLIDDHSSDGTGELAAAGGAKVVRPVLPLGAWGAMQTGIRYGLKKGYAAVITMDADGQHEVDELPALVTASKMCDVVVGAFPERASAARKVAWWWFRTLAGFELQDLTSGFRFYNRRAMATLSSAEATLLDYQDIGSLLMLRKSGLSVQEVPVAMSLRKAGKSRIFRSWLTVVRYMAVTTLLCMSRWGPAQRDVSSS